MSDFLQKPLTDIINRNSFKCSFLDIVSESLQFDKGISQNVVIIINSNKKEISYSQP